ncbi:MAG: hypothetical protein INR63_30210 [Actinomycetospora chiangmaiensis]|nr:hypothetical protein [Actinomycetospora chiangmaiensis]
MGVCSDDPEHRVRQLAELRAAYQSRSGFPGDPAGRIARHSKALLERILIVLGGLPEDSNLRERGAGKVARRL